MDLQLPKGMRDFSPEEKILRDKITAVFTDVFQRYGFNPLETPILERWDVLTAKYGASDETDVNNEMYRLTDQGGRQLGLRFDLTVPASRFVGMNPHLKMPFKRYQMGDVFRDGPIKLGRYREFTQCDVDTFGCGKMTADAEVLRLILDVFSELDVEIELCVNNRKLLNALIAAAGVSADKAESAMISIDKLEKLGPDAVRVELERKSIPDDAITKLLGFLQVAGSNEEKLKLLESFMPEDTDMTGFEEFKELLTYLPKDSVIFNPGLARGLAYYTGTVFEAFLVKSEITSSVCGGGRYDKLIRVLQGGEKDTPAVGVAFGLEPITEFMKIKVKGQQGGSKKTVVQAFIIPIKCYEEALPTAQKLREAGVSTEMDLMGRGISKNLEYANSLDIPYVIIIGKKELAEGKVKLKDMVSGEEKLITPDDLVADFTAKFTNKEFD